MSSIKLLALTLSWPLTVTQKSRQVSQRGMAGTAAPTGDGGTPGGGSTQDFEASVRCVLTGFHDKIPNLDVPKHLKAKYQAGWKWHAHSQAMGFLFIIMHYTNGSTGQVLHSLSLSETCETRVSTQKTSYNKCSWWVAAKVLQSKLLAKAWPCSSSCGAGPSQNGANSVLESHHF